MISINHIINLTYIVAAILFIVGLKQMSSPATARRGNQVSALAMFLAIVAALFEQGLHYQWILVGIIVGTLLGIVAARTVQMTQMPEMVALLNGFGGLASLLVGWVVYHGGGGLSPYTLVTIFLSVLIGGVTFTGSLVAYGKLSERITGRPVLYAGQQFVNGLLLITIIAAGIYYVLNPAEGYPVFVLIMILASILGIMVVIPIGGADMPVVISLLNSYSGLAACAAGFVIYNNLLIVTGSLVGASGIILTKIMCKAMNRSLANVLFSGFGAVSSKAIGSAITGEIKALSPQDAYYVLEAARSVVFVPGYGLAVAQAQHVVRELAQWLEKNGCEVKYAIHPVAGRMPGHMNVLLAEANVPYDQLVEMDSINPIIETVDVAVVIGANDVVNPAAREDASSPIYGMPIINVDKANSVFVLKRSMASGFAGIDNPLFYGENTRMIFGDAKATLTAIVAEFKEGAS